MTTNFLLTIPPYLTPSASWSASPGRVVGWVREYFHKERA